MIMRCLGVLALTLVGGHLSAQVQREISLSEAIRTAIERNLDVQLQRITLETRSISLNLTRAGYEPTVDATYNNLNSKNPSADRLDQVDSFDFDQQNLDITYSKAEDFGFSYQIVFNNQSTESGSGRAFGETFDSSIQFGFTQELLRGFAFDRDIPRKDEYVAKYDVNIAEHDLAIQIADLIQTTEDAYWDLVATNEQFVVSQQSLELARQLYEQNKIKIDVGTLAPIELVNTEANLASREKDLIDAENLIRAAEDRLKKAMNFPPNEWAIHLKPAEALHFDEDVPDIETSFQKALENRPELRKFNVQMRQSQLKEKYQVNQLLPSLTLSARYTSQGKDVPDDIETATYSDALEDALQRDFPSVYAELRMSWTPFNKAAKLNLKNARAELRRTDLLMDQARVDIMEQVRTAIRDIEASLKSLKASEKALRYREENLKAEEQKFQNGLSTNYRVSEEQENLARARSELIGAKVSYLKSKAKYYKAMGVLAKERNINFQ